MKNKIVKIHWLLIFVLLSACQGGLFSPPATPVPTATPFPATFEGKFDVGGYQLFIRCLGTDSPTIIMENGLCYQSFDDFHLSVLGGLSRTCIYSRAGMDPSDPSPKIPVTTQDQVNDLHNLLVKTGVPGPYVLVGHSIAGYNLLLYTNQFPKEVVGLVCVDCRMPQFSQRLLDLLGPEKEGESEELKKLRTNLKTPLYIQGPTWYERLDDIASELQVLKVTSLGDVPLIVLVSGIDEGPKEAKQAWSDTTKELVEMSTRSRMSVLAGFDHLTMLNAPEVFAAVKEVVAEARTNVK